MSAPPDRDLIALLGRVAVGLLLLAALVPRARTIAEPNVGDARAAAAVAGEAGSPLGLRAYERWTRSLAGDDDRAATWLQVSALAAHLLAALALAGLLLETHGLAAALFALALWAGLPIAVLHGALWGPENVGLAVGLGTGLAASRWIRGGGRGTAALAGLGSGVALLCGPAATCFLVAATAPHAARPRGRVAALLGVGLLLAGQLLHQGGPAGPPLPAPGAHPVQALGLAACSVGLLGLLLRATRPLVPGARERLDALAVGAPPKVDLVLPLLALGLLSLGPDSSWVLLAPAASAAGAALFVQVSRPLLALRAGLGPVVVAVGLVVVPGLAGFEHMRQTYLAEQPE